ncbi:GntR family transcriptional regulator [Roseovarius arcticus]|uniref:GntR family transcriptional regulator n=1 Tax=Roseovarius arcticus TaxID=2547404 RepID=UPI001BB26811|nr:GntR family transcriptional regulator [Roseovarius arcticus]
MITPKQNIHRDRVYSRLGELIRCGQFRPGEKISIRNLASDLEISATPVREALYRLISEGVLQSETNKTAYIPLYTPEQIREIKEIRLHIECFAAERAALRGTPEVANNLRKISAKIKEARDVENRRADLALVHEFQFELYNTCNMPDLIRIISSLWLKTGPYLNLLFPYYILSTSADRGDWRERIAVAVEKKDAPAVKEEIRQDITQSLDYIESIVSAANQLNK